MPKVKSPGYYAEIAAEERRLAKTATAKMRRVHRITAAHYDMLEHAALQSQVTALKPPKKAD